MIISASRRTDIPCYYSEWFMNRVRAGYALARNPMNPSQIKRAEISPDETEIIVFWTKHAHNMQAHLSELDRRGFMYYFQYTITPYETDIEPNLRPKPEIVDDFRRLSGRLGARRVVWRYDPILFNSAIDVNFHMSNFERLADALSGYTDTVTISFVDMYSKLKSPLVREVPEGDMLALAEFIGKAARARGMRAVACCERAELTEYGVERAACIDRARIEDILARPLALRADRNQRPGCGCVASVDIGAYDTCLNGCAYCYANKSESAARRKSALTSPESEALIG